MITVSLPFDAPKGSHEDVNVWKNKIKYSQVKNHELEFVQISASVCDIKLRAIWILRKSGNYSIKFKLNMDYVEKLHQVVDAINSSNGGHRGCIPFFFIVLHASSIHSRRKG